MYYIKLLLYDIVTVTVRYCHCSSMILSLLLYDIVTVPLRYCHCSSTLLSLLLYNIITVTLRYLVMVSLQRVMLRIRAVLVQLPLQRMVDKTGTEETLGHILKGGVEHHKHQRARIEQPVFVVVKQTIQHFSVSTKLKSSVMIVDFWVTGNIDVPINRRQAMMPQF